MWCRHWRAQQIWWHLVPIVNKKNRVSYQDIGVTLAHPRSIIRMSYFLVLLPCTEDNINLPHPASSLLFQSPLVLISERESMIKSRNLCSCVSFIYWSHNSPFLSISNLLIPIYRKLHFFLLFVYMLTVNSLRHGYHLTWARRTAVLFLHVETFEHFNRRLCFCKICF